VTGKEKSLNEIKEIISKRRGERGNLVSKKALKPHIGKYILEEVVNVYQSKKHLSI